MRRSVHQSGRDADRRGSLFHYYMVYLALTSMLLLSTGVCLHSLIEADRRDLVESQHLKLLLMTERQLRSDLRSADRVESDDASLVLTSGDRQIVWNIESPVLRREVRPGDAVQMREDFRFSRFTQLSFLQGTQNQLLLSITEPPALGEPEKTAEPGSDREEKAGQRPPPGGTLPGRSVQLLLRMDSQESIPEASADAGTPPASGAAMVDNATSGSLRPESAAGTPKPSGDET